MAETSVHAAAILHDGLGLRKHLSELLEPYKPKSISEPLVLFVVDLVGFFVSLASAVLAPLPLKFLGSLGIWLFTSRLFVIGHDACHMALTEHRSLNQVIGRIAFLPSLTPYSLWDVGHNVVHHGFSNVRGKDYVWEPMTPAQYAASPRSRQALERLYRSGWGFGLYYFVEVWCKRMYFPSATTLRARRRVFTTDSVLVTLFAIAWSTAASAVGNGTPDGAGWAWIAAFALPFSMWNFSMGFIVFVHHTHPTIAWYADKQARSAQHGYLTSTVHVVLPSGLGRLLHNIMDHPVHHVNTSVPFYRLPAAQSMLSERAAGLFLTERLTLASLRESVRTCKLYDYRRQQWVGFDGMPSGPSRKH